MEMFNIYIAHLQCVGSLTSHNSTVKRGLPFIVLTREDLKVWPFANVITKAALSPQLFKDPECWSGRDLNLRPPPQQSGALPTELTGQPTCRPLLYRFLSINWGNRLYIQLININYIDFIDCLLIIDFHQLVTPGFNIINTSLCPFAVCIWEVQLHEWSNSGAHKRPI